MSSCDQKGISFQFETLKGGVFTHVLLNVLDRYVKGGYEVSLLGIITEIQDEVLNFLDTNSENTLFQTPLLKGENVVIYHGDSPVAKNLEKFTHAQVKAKEKADELLEQILDDHKSWVQDQRFKNNPASNSYKMMLNPFTSMYEKYLSKGQDNRRLNWDKLKSVFEIYKDDDLGTPNLSRADLSHAGFHDTKFPHGISFYRAKLNSVDFENSNLSEVDFSRCSMTGCDFSEVKMNKCIFRDAYIGHSEFAGSTFIKCDFERSNFNQSKLHHSDLTDSSFISANLQDSDLSNGSAMSADFTNTDLRGCKLNNSDFSNATFTGANLYGTARDGWNIENVKCQYVYWDKEGKERFPPDSNFERGEFVTQYRNYTEFSYAFKNGFTPIDLALASYIVDKINEAKFGFTIKIDNASVRGLNPVINFIMVKGDDRKKDALNLFRLEFEQKEEEYKKFLGNINNQLTEQKQLTDSSTRQLDKVNARQDLIEALLIASISQSMGGMNFELSPENVDLITGRQTVNDQELNSSGNANEIHAIKLCDKNKSVQVSENIPVEFNSIKQYAVFKAVLEVNYPEFHGPINRKEMAKRASEYDLLLTPLDTQAKRNWFALTTSEEISKISFTLRKYCESNPRLAFLKPLILESRQARLNLLNYEIQNDDSIPCGKLISDY